MAVSERLVVETRSDVFYFLFSILTVRAWVEVMGTISRLIASRKPGEGFLPATIPGHGAGDAFVGGVSLIA
jgi:hypothetical protein